LTVLIDSCIWIDYFEGTEKSKKVLKYIESEVTLIASTINIAEIYRHFLSKKSINEADEAINLILNRCYVFPVNLDTSILAAQLKHKHKMTLGDALILSTATIKNAKLITFDSDFTQFENCEVY
jgi:predicted nucleic acid-binding protein